MERILGRVDQKAKALSDMLQLVADSFYPQHQAKEAPAKIPQTAVCGYFKSSLLGQANHMERCLCLITIPKLNRETHGQLETSLPTLYD